jgi:hypothetical protein
VAQTRGSFPALVDNVDKVVFGVVGTTLKELPSKWRKYFRVESSDRKFERRTSYAMFSTVPLKGEGEDYTTDLIDQGYTKDFTHLEFGLAYEVTETAQEDDQFNVISDHAKGLARAARVAEETYAARLHNLYTTEKTPDNVAAYASTHTFIKGGTGSNIVNLDLSRTALETALTLIHTDSKSDEGHYMDPPDGYILEVPPALEFLADRIVNSSGLPGSADNDRNPVKARYSIDVAVNPYFTDTDSWRLVAKNKMHGMLSYTRVPIGMKPPVQMPRSDNRIYKIRFRRSWGWDRWQGVVGSPGA